jgi:hypothetical protein
MFLIGLTVGILSGGVQFWLLARFTRMVTSGALRTLPVLLGLAQLLLPLSVLLAVAFLRRQDLLWTGTGIAGVLVFGGLIRFIVSTRKQEGGGDNHN